MQSIRYILQIGVLLLGFSSCNSKDTADASIQIEEGNQLDEISITLSQFSLSNMEIGTFTNEVFHETIACNGIFDVPPEKKADVSSYFGGYVKSLALHEGEKVSKGQTLFVLENPEYIQVQQDYLSVKSQLDYLLLDYERQQILATENISAQKNFKKAEADYFSSLAHFEALKKELEMMSINPGLVSPSNLRTSINILAPCNGYITEVHANLGMYLNPSDLAVKLVNTDHMHLELSIFESDLPFVKEGQEVYFSLPNQEELHHKGTIYLTGKVIDPVKRTVGIHVHYDEDALNVAPGMFAKALIYTSDKKVMTLPRAAVVNLDEEYFVLEVIEKNNEKIILQRKQVKIGDLQLGNYEILNAEEFDSTATFLTEGAFNLILD